MPEFADDEPAHCHAAGQNGAERRGEEMRLLRRGQPIILRDESANRNARELVEEREHGLPYRAADQFEIDVDTIGAGGSKLVGEARRPMIDRSIEATLVRSDEHKSEHTSQILLSYAVLSLKKYIEKYTALIFTYDH